MTTEYDEVKTRHPSVPPVVLVSPTPGKKSKRKGLLVPGEHLVGAVSMVLGTGLVLGLVLAMNAAVSPPQAPPGESTTDFVVEKPPPPKKQKTQKPPVPRQRKTASTPRAPLPDLASALGGVNFNLPGLEAVDLSGVGQSVLGDVNRRMTMTADAVDEPPKPRHRVQPEYPSRARERGIQGHVTLKLKVSSGGDVAMVRVIDANPKGIFETCAIASIKQWQFDPGMYQGEPVETWVNQTLRFELN